MSLREGQVYGSVWTVYAIHEYCTGDEVRTGTK